MRHISELTVKEGGGLWDAIMPAPAHKPFIGNAYKYKEPDRFVFMSGVERLGVQFDGHIWADIDLQSVELDRQKAVEYLESIGISL